MLLLITAEGVERIRSANPIAGVVAEHGCEPVGSGPERVARCPFRPSCGRTLVFDTRTGRYWCVSCGERGDVIGFVVWADHVTFAGALAQLARRAGLDLDEVMQPKPASRATRPREHTPASETPLWALTPPGVE